jgi:uncharacterized membrane protein YsdA (DUF1294 family)
MLSASQLAILVIPTLGMLYLAIARVTIWVGPLHLALSVLTYLVYRYDKGRARSGGRRISERTLHILEALGGWPGAMLAQQHFRHKSRKVRYRWVFWTLVALHQVLWIYILASALLGAFR